MLKKLKLIIFIVFYIYQTSAFSKASDDKDFNPKYLSNYLSAIILQNNYNSEDSAKRFNSSKILINEHEEFLKKYISISAEFIDAFNSKHKIKSSSKLSLNASQYVSNVSINTGEGSSNEKKKESGASLTEELKNLKELLDSGAITKEEFKKAKEKLLN